MTVNRDNCQSDQSSIVSLSLSFKHHCSFIVITTSSLHLLYVIMTSSHLHLVHVIMTSSYVIMTSLSPITFTHGAGSTTDPSEDVESLDLLINLGCFDSIPDPEPWSDSGELELILCCCCSTSSRFLVRASISAVVSAWVSTAVGRGKGGRREDRGWTEKGERGKGKKREKRN